MTVDTPYPFTRNPQTQMVKCQENTFYPKPTE